MCIYIYIYIYIKRYHIVLRYIMVRESRRGVLAPAGVQRRAAARPGAARPPLGVKDRTPEINTSELIMDFQ